MKAQEYKSQVKLLLDALPAVAAEECFAMHGGTAINLFLRDMTRLSVDIDLTYLPIETRADTLKNIESSLNRVRDRIQKKIPGIRVTVPFENPGQAKIFCSLRGIQIKIEVNTTIRGSLGEPKVLPLSAKTQEAFDLFAEMRIVPVGQLYGGKICAALDRQHPRDLFDVKYLLENEGFTPDIRRGFLFCLLSGDRPIHEMIRPTLTDQRKTMEIHFTSMAGDSFSYEDFEKTRDILIDTINKSLATEERKLMVSFKDGDPAWEKYGFSDFETFPSLQWKLQNIRKLKKENPKKHKEQLDALKERLDLREG